MSKVSVFRQFYSCTELLPQILMLTGLLSLYCNRNLLLQRKIGANTHFYLHKL